MYKYSVFILGSIFTLICCDSSIDKDRPYNPLDFEDTHIQKWISLIGDIENSDVHTYPFMPFP